MIKRFYSSYRYKQRCVTIPSKWLMNLSSRFLPVYNFSSGVLKDHFVSGRRITVKDKIPVIRACGQTGVELIVTLHKIYVNAKVVACGLREESDLPKETAPYVSPGA